MVSAKHPEFTVETVGGRELRVARWRWDQPGDHPPLLFFNGIGANIEAVAPLADALPDRAFITFDMPGVGGSPDPVVPYNPFLMSWHASDLLERFGAPLVDVMGVSWGGAMAQHFALQHAGQVRKLVLAATTAGMLMVPGKLGALSKMADPRRYVDPAFMEQHFRTLYGGLTGGKDEHIARLKPPSPRGYLYQLLCMIGWTSVPVLPFLKAETLIMMGEEDAIVPLINGKILNTLIPGSRLETFPDGGHLFMLTHKDRTVSLLREFLTETRAAA
ncbi:alpha/beta fold hydrolase [Novosphingobium sp.]|uniref:alpha/beta fold hydrolase n=1 Tax=Novosphingobium sp. TaxID=1874826 RepID=UPI00261EA31C|nr:alpha/beta fold hydrolase [Novosphingobium sp.]